MKIQETPLKGLLLIEPQCFEDERGYFFETYQQKKYRQLNLPDFVQDNVSKSKKNVLRGLHYQLPNPQGKLVWISKGKVWDVAVDIRKNSSTFSRWFGVVLSEENHLQLYIPPGFAHGFCVLSDEALFHYKCTEFYTPSTEQGILWNDRELNISWPINQPILAAKDLNYPCLNEIPEHALFL